MSINIPIKKTRLNYNLRLIRLLLISLVSLLLSVKAVLAVSNNSVDDIVNEIKQLEKARDPKCYATASRLEDFMFGTPLTHEARFSKNLLQKSWAKNIWKTATEIAVAKNLTIISKDIINQAMTKNLTFSQDIKKHWIINFAGGQEIKINRDDKRQYSTVAYALRAILAVQQEYLMDFDINLLPMQQDGINQLKDGLELLSLSVLKITDAKARKNDQYQVDEGSLKEVWGSLAKMKTTQNITTTKRIVTNKPIDLSIVRKIIQQKVDSYKAYNQISNELFVRNLQVYYARISWPKDKSEGDLFRTLFTETMIQFAFDVYKESEKIALRNNHKMVLESDVHELIQSFIPHEINEYEDAIFFPKLSLTDRVTIEAYDMDSFRDSGSHWRYLDYAINSPKFSALLQPDPFALELMVENIAQFGVLSLRVSGDIGKKSGAKRLQQSFFVDGLKSIQERINRHVAVKDNSVDENGIVSSENISKKDSQETTTLREKLLREKLFSEVTEKVGISAMHRSSDWLNRLLRSYLQKSESVGVITIPPAFGGSGIAAEDINNDGYTDLLILSGVGNKLYLNEQGRSFKDITLESGIEWRRPSDNTFGEPRQPLIADLNNDGLQDIVITYVNDQHRVYKNLGDAKFEDVTDEANLGGLNLVGGPATVADFDNDGLLDLYVTYFGHYTKGILPTLKRRNDNGLPNQLFKNLGNFKFKNISMGSGTDHTGWTQAVTHTDLDSDGLQDIIVGNDFGVNAYLRNNGNGTFSNISAQLGTEKPSYTMNIGIGDLNQDLQPDIYISNIVTMNKEEKYVLPNEDTQMKFDADKLAKMRVVEANDLFLSKKDKSGNVSYELSEAVGRGYSSTGWSWDADFFDFDNDGDNDLYVLNGMNEFNLYSSENPYYEDPLKNEKKNVYIPVSTKESNVFFVNDGGKLVNRSDTSGVDLVGNSRSAAYLDFDRDGDLDIAVNNYHEKAVFYKNDLNKESSRWLKIKLVGDTKKNVNRDAIGARIILTTESGLTMWREISGSIGYMSVHPKIQHFGLGDEKVKNIKVIWPNGEVQELDGVVQNNEYVVFQARKVGKQR